MFSCRVLKDGIQELETRAMKFLFMEETPVAFFDKNKFSFSVADIFRVCPEVEEWVYQNKTSKVSTFISYQKLDEIKQMFHEHFAI